MRAPHKHVGAGELEACENSHFLPRDGPVLSGWNPSVYNLNVNVCLSPCSFHAASPTQLVDRMEWAVTIVISLTGSVCAHLLRQTLFAARCLSFSPLLITLLIVFPSTDLYLRIFIQRTECRTEQSKYFLVFVLYTQHKLPVTVSVHLIVQCLVLGWKCLYIFIIKMKISYIFIFF